VLDVGREQFLVLLLVMKAYLDAPRELVIEIGAKQIKNGVVYARAVGRDLVVTWSREKATARTVVLLSDRVVVTVEQHGVGGRRKALDTGRTHHERLEEPRRVCAVPLCRARIRHTLNALVFEGQGRSERFGLRTHAFKIARKPI